MKNKESQSLSDWFPVLEWERLPNFGYCHTCESTEDFFSSYLRTPEIERLTNNLLTTLTGRFEQHNVRLLGVPGGGKTSFIYSLFFAAKTQSGPKILSDYCFYIWHINRAAVDDAASCQEIVLEHVVGAWEKYYRLCGLGNIFNSINEQKISLKDKANKLTQYFRDHKSAFSKVLLLIVDDADTLDSAAVDRVIVALYRHMEVASVKKWLVLREATYTGYDGTLKNKVNGFFPDPYVFPRVDVVKLIEHRIRNKAGKAASKNPFSQSLCEMLLTLHEGNLRDVLSGLKTVLEEVQPGEFTASTDISVIRNYLDKAAVRHLLELNILPNLHDPKLRNAMLPLPLDTLVLARFIQEKDLLFGAINSALQVRFHKAGLTPSQSAILKESNFLFTLNALAEAKLIDRRGKNVRLTNLGCVTAQYADRNYYRDDALLMLPSDDRQGFYTSLCLVQIDHEKIALELIM